MIHVFLYDEYIDSQLRRSSWSRGSPQSRYGLEVAFEVMLPWLGPEVVVAAIGCGDGYILDLLREKAGFAFGLDYHFGKLNCALEHGNAVVQGDFHYLPLRGSSVNVIHCSHVL